MPKPVFGPISQNSIAQIHQSLGQVSAFLQNHFLTPYLSNGQIQQIVQHLIAGGADNSHESQAISYTVVNFSANFMDIALTNVHNTTLCGLVIQEMQQVKGPTGVTLNASLGPTPVPNPHDFQIV